MNGIYGCTGRESLDTWEDSASVEVEPDGLWAHAAGQVFQSRFGMCAERDLDTRAEQSSGLACGVPNFCRLIVEDWR
jgi:hypothetical protein